MATTETHWAESIGVRAFESVSEMVRAADLDWDRLDELREAKTEYDDPHDRVGVDCDNNSEAWAMDNPDDAEELAELEADAGDCEDFEDAERRITEDPLSVEVGGWWTPGGDAEPSEYRVLLATGGPAVRIRGDLGAMMEPTSATLEVQDWFKPWTEYPCDEYVLLSYVARLYFGE